MTRQRTRGWLSCLAVVVGLCGSHGASAHDASDKLEASMVVTGRVTIERDGSVSAWKIDQREELPAEVAALVDESAPVWQFEPVVIGGSPVRGHARMSLQIVAKPLADGDFGASIAGGYFGHAALTPQEREATGATVEPDPRFASLVEMRPPRYPVEALRRNFEGTVHMALRVGRDGAVEDVVVERVDLAKIAAPWRMAQMRTLFADAAEAAARDWRARIPTLGVLSTEDFWTLRTRVDYALGASQRPYGDWQVYVPGPRSLIPWETAGATSTPGTLAPGAVHLGDTGPRLLTPLGD